jgi:hypothetical protein
MSGIVENATCVVCFSWQNNPGETFFQMTFNSCPPLAVGQALTLRQEGDPTGWVPGTIWKSGKAVEIVRIEHEYRTTRSSTVASIRQYHTVFVTVKRGSE